VKYISLFAGIGGFDLALNRLGHTCVWANEWDKYAAQIYTKNFETPQSESGSGSWSDSSNLNGEPRTYRRGESPTGRLDTRDITTVATSEIPDHELLVGGFPCQAFSIAGKRRGFDDTRGTLFFEIARILKDKQPKYFILENVKGLLSHDNGNTFKVIISTLTELGYDLQWQVLNSKNFGVPQNRERVFIVGHLRGERRPEVFPLGQNSQSDIVLPTLTSRYYGGQANGGYIGHKQAQEINVVGTLETDGWEKRHEQIRRVHGIGGISPTIPTGTGGGVMTKIAIPVLTPGRAEKRQNGRRFKENGEPSFTLTGQDKHGVSDGMRIRRLTPLECERLQGFPDGWTEGISDTQRYKCLGNAVTVNVVYEIAKRL